MTALDRRILRPGLTLSLPTLVAVYADHHRGIPPAPVCPGCGHRFPNGDTTSECPTLAVVRPLLQRRRNEDPTAVSPLTPVQLSDLKREVRTPRRRAAQPAPEPELFDSTPYRRSGGLR